MRLGILGSTRGSGLPKLISAIQDGRLHADIAVVISNKSDSGILALAQEAALPAVYLNPETFQSRVQFDQAVSDCLHQHKVDMVVLLGYMCILSAEFVRQWSGSVINTHPSLLPKYAGLMDLNVHQAVLASGDRESGCTVHEVVAEVDAGPILLQKKCPVLLGDTAETLKSRVQDLEIEALIEVVNGVALLLQSSFTT